MYAIWSDHKDIFWHYSTWLMNRFVQAASGFRILAGLSLPELPLKTKREFSAHGSKVLFITSQNVMTIFSHFRCFLLQPGLKGRCCDVLKFINVIPNCSKFLKMNIFQTSCFHPKYFFIHCFDNQLINPVMACIIT